MGISMTYKKALVSLNSAVMQIVIQNVTDIRYITTVHYLMNQKIRELKRTGDTLDDTNVQHPIRSAIDSKTQLTV